MMRRNFKKSVKVAIIVRARRRAIELSLDPLVSGPVCEKCSEPTKHRFEIHHLREDALEIDKGRPLTAADGALWCIPCHRAHTASVSLPAIAKAKRREASHLGARRDKRPIQGNPDALKSRERPKHQGREHVVSPPGIARRYVTQEPAGKRPPFAPAYGQARIREGAVAEGEAVGSHATASPLAASPIPLKKAGPSKS